MKKYISASVILFAALATLPDMAVSQSTYLDPFANYQRLDLYRQHEMLKGANNKIEDTKPAPKPKAVQIELDKHKIRMEMSLADFLAARDAGRKYLEEGNADKAQVIFEGLAEIDSKDVDANASVQGGLGFVYYIKGDSNKALLHLNEGLGRNNRMASAMLIRAKIYMMKEDYYNVSSNSEFLLEVTLPEIEAAKPGTTKEIAREARRMLAEAKKHIYK